MTFRAEAGIFTKPMFSETVNGDAIAFIQGDGFVLGVVIDGLGHGTYANRASEMAVEFIKNNPDTPIGRLLEDCHEEIRGTRGAAVTLLKIYLDTGKLEFTGIGNVDMKTQTRDGFHPVTFPGIIGYNLRKVKVFDGQGASGDIFCIHSDGISSRFNLEEQECENVQEMADSIGAVFGKERDDSTVLIIKIHEEQ
jgi:hypothetical protein